MSIKHERIQNTIHKHLTLIITQKLNNPKIGFVTVNDVQVTSDFSFANVYLTILGKEEKINASLKALNQSKGFIRSELSKVLKIYKCPQLNFHYDKTRQKANRIEEILHQLTKE